MSVLWGNQVKRRYPVRDVSGADLRRLFFWGVLLTLGIWWLWPNR